VNEDLLAKQERVYREIRERIRRGQYGPGYRLVMDVLARELHVSPIPVREAVRRLEADGFVRYTRNIGFSVVERSLEAASALLEALAVLEGWAAGAARDGVDVAQLRALTVELSAALDRADLAAAARLDRTFHEQCWQGCPNRYVKDEIGRLYAHLDFQLPDLFQRAPGLGRRALHDHWDLIQALSEGAAPRVIEDRMRRHGLQAVEVLALGAGRI
jgi:DNA-binding GntR family transcriptional regulator